MALADPTITYLYRMDINEEGYLKLIWFKKSLPGARKVAFQKDTLLLLTMFNEVLQVKTKSDNTIEVIKLKEE